MQHLLRIIQLSSVQHVGAVSDHFVDIHIALCSGTCLPDHKRKLVVETALQDFVAHPADQCCLFSWQHAKFLVGKGGSLIEYSKGVNDFKRHTDSSSCTKIVTRSFCLCSSLSASGHLHFAYCVPSNTAVH